MFPPPQGIFSADANQVDTSFNLSAIHTLMID